MAEEIINKIALSGIITLDLEQFYPKAEVVEIDIKDFLFMGMILKEKDFRAQLVQMDWDVYRDKIVGIYCSVDTLIPHWAYMLLAVHLETVAVAVYYGDKLAAVQQYMVSALHHHIHKEDYQDAKVVVKGCGQYDISAAMYLEIAKMLRPFVSSLMYGEPCSTVPVYKRKKIV